MSVSLADMAIGFAAGLGLGAAQFALLWASLRGGGLARPGRLAASAALRFAGLLAGLWLLGRSAGDPAAALLAAGLGLLAARAAALRAVRGG